MCLHLYTNVPTGWRNLDFANSFILYLVVFGLFWDLCSAVQLKQSCYYFLNLSIETLNYHDKKQVSIRNWLPAAKGSRWWQQLQQKTVCGLGTVVFITLLAHNDCSRWRLAIERMLPNDIDLKLTWSWIPHSKRLRPHDITEWTF